MSVRLKDEVLLLMSHKCFIDSFIKPIVEEYRSIYIYNHDCRYSIKPGKPQAGWSEKLLIHGPVPVHAVFTLSTLSLMMDCASKGMDTPLRK